MIPQSSNFISVLQHNLHRSPTALSQFLTLAHSQKAQVLLIQEPPYYFCKTSNCYCIPGAPRFTFADLGCSPPKTAIIALTQAQILHSSSHCVAIYLPEFECSFASIYFHPQDHSLPPPGIFSRIHSLAPSGSAIIIGADTNSYSVLWNSHIVSGSPVFSPQWRRGDEIIQEAALAGFVPVCQQGQFSTFHGNSRNLNSTIDAVFTTRLDLLSSYNIIEFATVSDHHVITFSVRMSSKVNLPFKTKINLHSLVRELSSVLSEFSISFNVEDDISKLQCAFKEATSRVTTRNCRQFSKPRWWSTHISSLSSKVRSLARRYKRNPTDYNRVLWLTVADSFRKARAKAASDSFIKFMSTHPDVSSILRNKMKSAVGPSFSTLSHESGTKLISEMFHTVEPSNYLTLFEHRNQLLQDNFLAGESCTHAEVHEAVRLTKLNKSCAASDPSVAIKLALSNPELSEVFYPIICDIFSRCFQQSLFPKVWKRGFVVFIPKANSTKAKPTFRPITILPLLGRIMDRILYRRLARLVFAAPHPLGLSPSQHGFTRNKSTESCNFDRLNFVESSRKSNLHSAIVSLDIAGAFNYIAPRTILTTFNFHSYLPAPLVAICISYLTTREVFLSSRDEPIEIFCATPQGGVSSPLILNLVLAYVTHLIEDMFSVSSLNGAIRWLVNSYADDFVICISSLLGVLRLALPKFTCEIVSIFLDLSFTISSKSEFLIIAPIGEVTPYFGFDASLSVIIRQVDNLQLLGTRFHSSLNFCSHAILAISKAKRRLIVLRSFVKLNWGPVPSFILNLFKTIVLPLLSYNSPTWFSAISSGQVRHELYSLFSLAAKIGLRGFRKSSNFVYLNLADLPDPLFWILSSATKRILHSICPPTEWFSLGSSRPLLIRSFLKNTKLLPLLGSAFECKPNVDLVPVLPSQLLFVIPTPSEAAALALSTEAAIYCDGSLTSIGGGASAVLLVHGRVVAALAIPLPIFASVPVIELVAISLALYLAQEFACHPSHIFTDSLSALKLLRCGSTPLCKFILQQLRSQLLPPNSLTISWIKAHSDKSPDPSLFCLGNCLADLLAKEVANKVTNVSPVFDSVVLRSPSKSYLILISSLVPVSRCFSLQVIAKLGKLNCRNLWAQQMPRLGRTINLFFGISPMAFLFCKQDLHLLSPQIISMLQGHNFTPRSSFLYGKRMDSLCKFCSSPEANVVHFLCFCPYFGPSRTESFPNVSLNSKSIYKILSVPSERRRLFSLLLKIYVEAASLQPKSLPRKMASL